MNHDLTPINKNDTILNAQNGANWQQAAHDWLTNFASDRTQRAYRAAWVDFLRFIGKT
ncbi:MAG: hypothetical protein HN922_06505, partial [Anaerolineae bacterium]|nr:hypothetical protein [Anaerolineae bacterium]